MQSEIVKTYKNRDDFEIYTTDYKEHLEDIVKSFSETECIIYVCGGDGNFVETPSCLVNKKAYLELIPYGTANEFSKNFNYKNFSLASTLNPFIESCDIIKVSDIYSINILRFGLDRMGLKNTYSILSKFPFLKSSAYLFGVLKSIFRFKSTNLSCELEISSREHIAFDWSLIPGAICNGSYYGNGFNPSPHSLISDGILEMVLAKNMNFKELINIIPTYERAFI